jgi:HK97 family phage major capsid protein
LLQSSIDFENWVRGQLQKAIAEAVDRAAIVGTGANDQPTGLLATSGLGSYAWQVGSAAWVNIVDQVAVLRAANSDLNKAAWLTDHTVRADWKKTPVVSGASNMIIERGFKPRQAMVDDLPFLDHTDVTTGKVALGDFSSLMVALWGGIQLTYDPFSLKKSGQIELYAETYADVGVRQPADFCIGDSGVTHAGSI